jgi:RNase adaptor protein for sRNA GlmZ degradation
MLQTLGAYGFRGLIQQKEIFLRSIAPALRQLTGFLEEYPQYPPYNELRKLLDNLVQPDVLKRFEPVPYEQQQLDKLQVHVYSFSYKKGIPVDETGNGGGFVFDCRGIVNPGRVEAYKQLTGKDKQVMDFLEQKTKMPEFLKGIFSVMDISIQNYLERGFEHLSVSFGCTGGQHRSVFAAEALAEHLRTSFGLQPKVIHLEQEKNTIERR